jgi:hypothetical protein
MTRASGFLVFLAIWLALVAASVAIAGDGAPLISNVAVGGVGSRSAVLSAKIDPDGTTTTFDSRREWGTCQQGKKEVECAGTGKVALEKPHVLPAGNEPKDVTIKLDHLTPDCTYEVLVQAANASGKSASEAIRFTTTGRRKSSLCPH